MKLSILICTLPERYDKLSRLKDILEKQVVNYRGHVEILIHDAGRTMPTGTKRNILIKQASGEYIVFVDDDDWVPEYYIQDILKAIETNPDCVTFKGWMTTNGTSRVNFIIRLGEKYEERGGIYYRFPNHICPIRKSIAASYRFPSVWQSEDYTWAKHLNDKKLIKSEVFIDKEMYHYDFRNQNETINKPRRRMIR